MYRRGFLQMMAATVAVAPARPLWAATPACIVVIGAGIMGASIAYRLAKRGAQVTILEKEAPASGTTRNSFAWMNSSGKSPRSYYELNLAGMLGWRRLELEIGSDLPIQWGGGISWGPAGAELVAAHKSILMPAPVRRLAHSSSHAPQYPTDSVLLNACCPPLPFKPSHCPDWKQSASIGAWARPPPRPLRH
jgi:hypothetical protein